MTNLTNPLFGLLFLQRNSTIVHLRQGSFKFPFFSVQQKNENRTFSNVIEPILKPIETIPQRGIELRDGLNHKFYTKSEATVIIQPSPLLESNEDLFIHPALSRKQNNNHMVQNNSFLDHSYTLRKGTHVAIYLLLTPQETNDFRPINPNSVRHILKKNHDDAIPFKNGLAETVFHKVMKSRKPIGSQHQKIWAFKRNIRPYRRVFSMNYAN